MRKPAIKPSLWPRAIIAYFIVFTTAMTAWVAFALHQKTDLVRDDYYEQEIRYQEQVDRITRTQAIRGQYRVGYDSAERAITIQLPEPHARSGAAGEIHLYRPSDARLDRTFPLALDANGRQRLQAKELQPGLWRLRASWGVQGKDYFFDEPLLVIAPGS